MTYRSSRVARLLALLVLVAVVALSPACSSCRREPEIADAAYREAVAAFYTGVAAMETTQEVLAREKFDRVIALAPSEPAAHANLGLLLLRQQEIEQATQTLAKAAQLAPASAEIQTLLALAASRAGELDAAVAYWRRALELRPEDRRAAFALARDLERQGGSEQEAQAQRTLAALVARRDNLAARLDLARLAAKRGDADALRHAIEPLAGASASWLPQAQAQLEAVRGDLAANPRAAATRIAFIKNFLVRDPEYRRAMSELTTPLEAIGVPLDRFLVLKNPEPAAAAPDTTLAFDPPRAVPRSGDRGGASGGPSGSAGADDGEVTWAGALSLTGEGAPVIVTATARGVRIVGRDTSAASAAAPNQGVAPGGPGPAPTNASPSSASASSAATGNAAPAASATPAGSAPAGATQTGGTQAAATPAGETAAGTAPQSAAPSASPPAPSSRPAAVLASASAPAPAAALPAETSGARGGSEASARAGGAAPRGVPASGPTSAPALAAAASGNRDSSQAGPARAGGVPASLPVSAPGSPVAASANRDGNQAEATRAGGAAPRSTSASGRSAAPAPVSGSAPARGPDGVLAADLTYDFRTDLVLAGAGGLSLLRQEPSGQFADVSAKSGLPAALLGAPAYGAWAADVDTDGDLDLVVAPVTGAPVVLRNNGDGTFAVRTPFAGVGAVRGFAWADFDGEGVPDAAMLQADGTIRLFVSLRGGSFREQTLPSTLPKAAAIAAAEVTGDALFDLVAVAPDGTIVRLSRTPESPSSDPAWTTAPLARIVDASASQTPGLTPGLARLIVADLDNNAAADLIVSSAADRHAAGHAGHADRSAGPTVAQGARGARPASNAGPAAASASPAVPAPSASAALASASPTVRAASPLAGSVPAAPDSRVTAGAAAPSVSAWTRVLLGGPVGTFSPLAASPDLRVLAAADLDEDGRLDLIGLRDADAVVVRSRGTKIYHWQRLRPRAATATGDQRINSFGIGGEVDVRAGLHAQKQPIASPIVHVGLGEATQADVIRIVWPNGVLQSEFEKRADATVAADQRLKGSCPWLFAWNGREMAFVTDLVWRSPLGLRINAQATADVVMTEDWVKVRGDQLVPRDGAYDLRITADLWETHFFDLVSLLVVDHPPGTEVFVDERFAVPAPTLDVKVTGPVRPFASVQARLDDRPDAPASTPSPTSTPTSLSTSTSPSTLMRTPTATPALDVSDVVFARDDRHLDVAGRGPYQGITRDHAVEMTLPEDAPRQGPLWLVAQGWVHPTDSSINVAIAQGAHAAPRGLALAVADADGRFREVRTGLGFPSGKDKTVLIDLTGLFPARGPRRVRLSTNLEIFWDRLGWAQGRPDVIVTPRRIDASHAELRYRGFSRTDQKDASTPERPRYQIAGTAPRWRDLEGWYTRFGDVRPLLARVDDRYVIMNAGDELAFRFPEAPPPAPGQLRDFVVIGDGWVKDGDYNTAFSRTVLPLPTHGDARYDRPPGRLEEDPVFRAHPQDFEVYHTRYVSPDAVRDALRSRETPPAQARPPQAPPPAAGTR